MQDFRRLAPMLVEGQDAVQLLVYPAHMQNIHGISWLVCSVLALSGAAWAMLCRSTWNLNCTSTIGKAEMCWQPPTVVYKRRENSSYLAT